MHPRKGFITFEGIEGAGKSTQIGLLRDYLEKRGYAVVVTCEPGGTRLGKKIRAILLDPVETGIDPLAELLLYAADRAQHVAEVIRPALQAGKLVLSDRYSDATTAYQGAARGISPERLKNVHRIAADDLQPDLTFLLDLPVERGLAMAKQRREKRGASASRPDRMEQEEAAFHEAVRRAYLALAAAEKKRIKLIQGDQDPASVHRDIIHYVEDYFRT